MNADKEKMKCPLQMNRLRRKAMNHAHNPTFILFTLL
jgi:hypothetical protein